MQARRNSPYFGKKRFINISDGWEKDKKDLRRQAIKKIVNTQKGKSKSIHTIRPKKTSIFRVKNFSISDLIIR
jgi:hypothetical protein